MFQLNSYKNKTHLKWIFKNYPKCYALTGKKAKKPIVFTGRLNTMLIVTGLINGIVIGLTYLSFWGFLWLILIHPFIPVIVNILCYPIEQAKRNYYIGDAKKILASKKDLTIIGITGSYGKTSMKYFLTTLMQGKYETLMTPESFNTPMGVVKTIRDSLRGTHKFFICEMGARQEFDIQELCDIVHPQFGIITSIGEQHLETFHTIETIIKTKYELVNAASVKLVFVNGDNIFIQNNLPQKDFYTYGLSDTVNYKAENIRVTTSGTVFDFRQNDTVLKDLQVKLVGEHNIQNLCGAIAVALYFKVREQELRNQLKKIQSPPHRLEMKKFNGYTILDDAYNSNPKGCEAALKTLSLFEGVKILITPGMVELGEKQDECNRVFGEIAANVCDFVYLVGKKQTTAILDGLKSKNFPDEKIIILENVKDAINQAFLINGEKIILLENDLPDNFL
jgi:UDP-N-acetylmuramoyl-tripeptide--D-alanyl-D-alanine ligase